MTTRAKMYTIELTENENVILDKIANGERELTELKGLL